MSKHVCVIDHSGVRHFHLIANQGSDEVTVTVDLRKGRDFDAYFRWHIERFGDAKDIHEAINTWIEEDNKYKFLYGMMELRLSGMTYKAIGGLCGMSSQKVSVLIKPLEREYVIRCDENIKKIQDILVRKDPEYDFMTDRRTVIQEMCAMVLGGEEMKQTLEQLCNMNLSTTPTPQ